MVLSMAAAGCQVFSPQESDPRAPASDPAEAFEQAGEPQPVQPGPGPADPDGLSSDIERLQDARRVYEHDKSQQSRELERQQARCRDNPDSESVELGDAAGGGAYCQE
ncbi:MAG: hypothetical protein CMN28_05615 [Salinisphaeraceae bacterium]|nr:hypothetical protein [Salinisphaeraceae bacterium]